MPFAKPERDRARLAGVHPDLVRVVERAADLCPRPFIVVQGVRSLAEQRANVAKGASKTMNSRHLKAANGYGHAVDLLIVDGPRELWGEAPVIAAAMKAASRDLGIPITWGGDFRSFYDGPHFELPWDSYPSGKPLGKSRTMAGLGLVSTGVVGTETADGLGEGVSQIVEQLAPAAAVSPSIASAVAIVKAVAAVAVVGGILLAAYARWDDAGRPLPGWAPGWLRRLVGADVGDAG